MTGLLSFFLEGSGVLVCACGRMSAELCDPPLCQAVAGCLH